MNNSNAAAGTCVYENTRLEYVVVSLEFIRNKSLKIEVVCLNPRSFDKEATLKYTTTNLSLPDERLNIALSIMDDVIKNLDLPKDKLYKLVVKNHNVFYVCAT